MYWKRAYYMLMPISGNIKLKKRTELNEILCTPYSNSLFPLQGMVIEVQNLIHDRKYTRI